MGNDVYSNLAINPTGTTANRKLGSKLADVISVADFGAVGNGTTDDSGAINAASLALSQAGGGVLVFDPSKTYYIHSTVLIYPNVSFDGRGCTLQTDQGIWFMANPSPSSNGLTPIVSATITANPAAGAHTFTLDSVSGFNVGDIVSIRLGNNQYDAAETRYVLINTRITAVDAVGSTITVDQSVPYAIDLTSPPTAPGNKVVWKFQYVLRDTWIKNFNFECVKVPLPPPDDTIPNIEGGILLDYASDILIENIQANKNGDNSNGTGKNGGVNMGAGIVVMFHCERVSIRQLKLYRNTNTYNQSSKGRCLNFANCYDVTVQDVEASNITASFCFNESYCERILFENAIVRSEDNTGYRTLSGLALFFAGQGCVDIIYRNMAVEYPVAGTLLDGDGAATSFNVRFENLTWRGGFPEIAGGTSMLKGILDYNDGTNAFTVDLDDVTDGVLTVPLSPSMSDVHFPLKPGFLLPNMELYAPPFVTASHVTQIYLGAGEYHSNLTTGNQTQFARYGVFGTDSQPYNTIGNTLNPQTSIIVYTDSSASGYFIFRYKVARYVSSTGTFSPVALAEPDALRARNAPYFALVNVGTATAGQTTFTVPGGYSAGRILVFVNGTLRVNVTATNGSTIVFGAGLTAGDAVYVAVIV